MPKEVVESSYKDPSGFLYWSDGALYRQINPTYVSNFDAFMKSGLYSLLAEENLIVMHEELGSGENPQQKVIKPEILPFISHPYEWCFSQLKDAALLTLQIQKLSLEKGFVLKDATAYNVQFLKGNPIFIDTLSFETYEEGNAWVGYRQFCQHFLGPLALMSYKDLRFYQMFRTNLDGFPLDFVSKNLPASTRMNMPLLVHIHIHSKMQEKFSARPISAKKEGVMNKQALQELNSSLEKAISGISFPKRPNSVWGNYYDTSNYNETALNSKKDIVDRWLSKIFSTSVWDLGSNDGMFSMIASKYAKVVISMDNDPVCVERNYLKCKKENVQNVLPLVIDLTNPSPSIGWNNKERASLVERGPADTLLALALIHHLAIGNNVPFDKIFDFFAQMCENYLIVEFVPKEDSQVQRLLSTRKDIFSEYTRAGFEKAFSKRFELVDNSPVTDSKRAIYLLKKK